MFPPIPSWDAIHPLLVHVPLGLLFVAPLLVILGLFRGRAQAGFMLSALVVMLVGTVGIWLAISSGEAAEDFAESVAGAGAVLDHHEELAEVAQVMFSVLTPVYAVIVIVQLWVKRRLPGWLMPAVTVVFLLVYGGAVVVLANTGHEGARLVHEFGVHAMLRGAGAP